MSPTVNQPLSVPNAAQPVTRSAFTLVELMVVIAIIGILAATLVPAVMGALRTAKSGLLRQECANFEQAIEAYRLKYNDYPPDFSDFGLVERHYRKIFPEILDNELLLLFRLCDDEVDNSAAQIDTTRGTYVPAIMNRAEALIWAVGGFSSNPQRPFTGSGGPLDLLSGASAGSTTPSEYQYNSERDNALLDLDAASLTLSSPAAGAFSFTNRAQSSDDGDLFPVYRYREGHAPYVYFDSRTYRQMAVNAAIVNGAQQLNGFSVGAVEGNTFVRPVISTEVDATVDPPPSGDTYADISPTDLYPNANFSSVALRQFKFVNANTFQVLSPGLDGMYGESFNVTLAGNAIDGLPYYLQYPSGKILVPDATVATSDALIRTEVDRWNLNSWNAVASGRESFEKDNVANFSKNTFEDDLE